MDRRRTRSNKGLEEAPYTPQGAPNLVPAVTTTALLPPPPEAEPEIPLPEPEPALAPAPPPARKMKGVSEYRGSGRFESHCWCSGPRLQKALGNSGEGATSKAGKQLHLGSYASPLVAGKAFDIATIWIRRAIPMRVLESRGIATNASATMIDPIHQVPGA